MADDMSVQAAAAVSTTTSMANQKIAAKLLKQQANEQLAVATMATSLPTNPALGRNVNTTA